MEQHLFVVRLLVPVEKHYKCGSIIRRSLSMTAVSSLNIISSMCFPPNMLSCPKELSQHNRTSGVLAEAQTSLQPHNADCIKYTENINK